MKKVIPFVVGKPVTGEYFIDRADELAQMINMLSAVSSGASTNVALIGLRRTGKTSLFENVRIRMMKMKQIVPVLLNCFGISTKIRFSKMFMQEVTQAYILKTEDRLYKDRLVSFLKKELQELSKHISDVDISIAEFAKFNVKLRETKIDEDELVDMALRYPETLAESKNVYFVIMIDEFQDTLKWGDNFLKNFRRIIESQNRVAYAFSGSVTTIMRELLYRKRSPFYRQLVEIELGKLPAKSAREFVLSRFQKAGMKISNEEVNRLIEYSGSYPDYIQRLGLRLYQLGISQGKSSLDKQDVKNAYDEMILLLDGEFSTYFKSFTDFEKEVLIALAHGKTKPSSMAREIRKPISSLPQILHRLISHGIVEKFVEGHYRISDPVFSDWLSQRYPLIMGD
ncbi:MAG: AAA family ATPase [Candidatus Bathycorpusculaceae bacterium]